jgi:glycogen synthase
VKLPRGIVISSYPKGLAKEEIQIRLFLKYYINAFSEEEKNKIYNILKL